MHLIIHTDGGARENPGPAGIGVYITDEKRNVIEEHAKYLGVATNNHAEYAAAVLALERAVALKATSVELVADSELLIRQATGKYRVKNVEIGKQFMQLKRLESELGGHVRYRHVRREYNLEADRLSNEAMDQGMGRKRG